MVASQYLVHCWNCLGEFDAQGAVWCGCSSIKPTKVCPFCMSCFCAADRVYLENFWHKAPEGLKQERAGLGRVRQRLGDLLVQERVISHQELAAGLERRAETGELLGEALVATGALDRPTLDKYLKKHQGSFSADLATASIQPSLVRQVGVDLCYEKIVVPLEMQDMGDRLILTLAMADTSDGATVEEVGRRAGCRVIAEFAEAEEILEVLRNTFPREESRVGAAVEDMRVHILEWISAAVRQRASHIHVNTGRLELRVFLRIDGVVFEVDKYPKKYHPYLMREVRRLVHHPDGGAFSRGTTMVRVKGRRYRLTVGVRHTDHGEDVAVRVVNTAEFGRDLLQEIPDPEVRAALAMTLARPGLNLITSPLYHGRIDSAYALLWAEHQAGRQPVCLERMLTCPLPGVSQTEVSPAELPVRLAELDGDSPLFLMDLMHPRNLAAVLDAAHKRPVLATLKAMGVVPVLEWLMANLPGEELARHVHVVTNQRQARMVCDACRGPDIHSSTTVYLGLDQEGGREFQPQKGAGCAECGQRGYRGRTTLYEMFLVEPVVSFLEMGSPPEVLFQEGLEQGGKSLRASFLEAVREGRISLAEFEKVSF